MSSDLSNRERKERLFSRREQLFERRENARAEVETALTAWVENDTDENLEQLLDAREQVRRLNDVIRAVGQRIDRALSEGLEQTREQAKQRGKERREKEKRAREREEKKRKARVRETVAERLEDYPADWSGKEIEQAVSWAQDYHVKNATIPTVSRLVRDGPLTVEVDRESTFMGPTMPK